MTAKESKAVAWSCALSLRVAVIDENGVPQLSLNGSGIPSGVSLFHEDHVHTLNAFIKKMDGIIEEVGGVTASCINPYEDLKRALIGQKERAIKAESALHAAEAESALKDAQENEDIEYALRGEAESRIALKEMAVTTVQAQRDTYRKERDALQCELEVRMQELQALTLRLELVQAKLDAVLRVADKIAADGCNYYVVQLLRAALGCATTGEMK